MLPSTTGDQARHEKCGEAREINSSGEGEVKIEGKTGSGKGETVAERLERHPELEERVKRLLDVVENVSGDVRLADEAERRAIDELRAMGQQVMQGWGQRLADRCAQELESTGGVVRQSKKNFTGTARLAKSRCKNKPTL
jgi:hypothetical protein